ncbi:hypothetical protein [uncultured Megamonas sp.]|uniref:hypothetical protein n=1 Tax=uncultured Megamonas sp. TaxID=286140 RepID=UPI00259B2CD5|nr:hypothetical protein [uncultured Megamonas sp.]
MENRYLLIKVSILGNMLNLQEDSEFIKRLLSFGGEIKFHSYESIKKDFGYKTRSGIYKRINKLIKNGILTYTQDCTYHKVKIKGLVDG